MKSDERFDILIIGGTIIDGTRSPRFEADVGIRDGKIAAIGDTLDSNQFRRPRSERDTRRVGSAHTGPTCADGRRVLAAAPVFGQRKLVTRVDHLHIRPVEPLLRGSSQVQSGDLLAAKEAPRWAEYLATYQVRRTRQERGRRQPENASQHTGGVVQLNIAQPDMPTTSTSNTAIPITFPTITSLLVQTSIYDTACDVTSFGGGEDRHTHRSAFSAV